MFRFRDATVATGAFGQYVVKALQGSAARSTARKAGRKRIFIFDNPDSLEAFRFQLQAAYRSRRVELEQYDYLLWALAKSGSLLLVIHGDSLHYMCSEDEQDFEELLGKPLRVNDVLKNFKGVMRPHTYGHLALVHSA